MLRARAATARSRRSTRAGAAGSPAGARVLGRVLSGPLAQRLPGGPCEPLGLHPGGEGSSAGLLGRASAVARLGHHGRRRLNE
eukprot:5725496-Lingulodinium_polyedra.AAC.1